MNDPAHERADEKIAELESRLLKEYEKAYQEIEQKRREVMARFEQARAQMEKQYKSGQITHAEYKSFLKKQGQREQWYKDMANTFSRDMNNMNDIAARMINNELPEIYADNYNYGTYMIERGARIDTSFTMVNRDTIYQLMQGNTRLLPDVSVDKNKDIRWNRQKFNAAIRQSILQGDSVNDAAKRLRQVVGMNYNSSVRSARTAITAAQNMGRQRSYERAEDMGIKLKKQWQATLDGRTRNSHRHMDGETVPVKEEFSNGLMEPGDPGGHPAEIYNCRCRSISILDDVDYSDFPRHSKLGKMTYEEWKNEHSDK